MPSQQLTPNEVRRAEETVCRILGVTRCRINTDESGEVTEVHVVATADKSPKLLARDVDTCLRAEMDLQVDYRKIGVVLVDPAQKTSPHPAPKAAVTTLAEPEPLRTETVEAIAEFPVEEYSSRFAFHSVNLYISEDTVRAEVELARDDDSYFGSAQSDGPHASPSGIIAEATLKAVSEYLDESTKLCLGVVRRVAIVDADVFVVKVDLVTGRDRKSLLGAAVVSGNENQTVVFATLDAVNRVLGKLGYKSAVEYKIK